MTQAIEPKHISNSSSATPLRDQPVATSGSQITKEPLTHHLFTILDLSDLAEQLVGRTATGREVVDYDTYKTLREWEITLAAIGNFLSMARRDAFLHEELAIAAEFLNSLQARLDCAKKWRRTNSLVDEFNSIVRNNKN
jgi:hypothetical protein